MGSLTRRERDVIRAIRVHRARSVKAVAIRLHINSRTAEAFIASIHKKLPPDFERGTRPFLRVLLWSVQPLP